MKANERLLAVQILSQLLDNRISLQQAFQSNVLTPFTKELCFGVCRHYFRLEKMANKLLNKRPKSTSVWVCILIGLYQLHYLDVADYAVVKETVNVLPLIKAAWAKGLVNAVLRQYCRTKATLVQCLEQDISFKYGHPSWLMTQLKQDWPNDWQAICQANDERAPMTLRVNQRHISAKDYLDELIKKEIPATLTSYSSQGIRLLHPRDVSEIPGFGEGWVSVQDEAAQLAVSLLNLEPHLRVLDACCAPGGKTGHILESEPHLKECVALDVDAFRLQRVKDNLERLKLSATLLIGDATHPEQWGDGRLFDRILLDAPCSAMGVIRRHPDIKLLRTKADLQTIVSLQQQLLQSLWPLLAPGGLLVYATCSIMPIENNLQMRAFVKANADCEYLSLQHDWGHRLDFGYQILPGEDHMDGFFYSVVKKVS